jgi:hypothetical protein
LRSPRRRAKRAEAKGKTKSLAEFMKEGKETLREK